MPRPTEERWRSIRAAWEGSPNPGLSWLTKGSGGPWDVSAEALRRRRLAEGWRKHEPAQSGAGGKVGCWGADAAARGAHGPPARVFALGDDPGRSDDDLRDALLRRQRDDWGAVRRVLDAAVADGRVEAIRRVKFLAEVIAGLQEGEPRVHGLDAALIDYEALSDRQLADIAAGRWQRRAR